MNKRIFCDVAITAVLLLGATALSFCFFHFGNKNLANITVIYILALILIALKTSGYFYGIGASLFCVAAVNYFFSYPYNVIDPQSILADVSIELALKIRNGMDPQEACAKYLYK